MRTKSLPACFFIVSLALLTTVAEAQPPAPGTSGKPVLARPLAEAMTKKARELFSDGTQAAAQGRLADALAAFTGADALSPHYSNKCNLGDVELRLGMFVDAAGHMRTCSRGLEGDARATAAEREGAKKIYEAAKTKVAEIAITTNVEGAQVTLGATVLGKAPLAESAFAEPGKMAAKATLDGYQDAKVEVEGKAGQVVPVTLTLVKKVEALPTSSAVPTTSPTAPPSQSTAILVGGGAAAGVSLIVGGVLLGLGEQTRSDLRADTPKNVDGSLVCAKETAPGTADPACEDFRARMRAGNALGQAGVGLMVAGGLFGLATAGYAIFWRPPPQKAAQLQWSPVVAPTAAGIVCTGTF